MATLAGRRSRPPARAYFRLDSSVRYSMECIEFPCFLLTRMTGNNRVQLTSSVCAPMIRATINMLKTTDNSTKIGRARVAAMTLKEKIGLMSGRSITKLLLPFHVLVFRHYNRTPYNNNAVERLGVPSMRFCDGPRGVVSQNSTCFPVAMARGATFDTALERRVGDVIGKGSHGRRRQRLGSRYHKCFRLSFEAHSGDYVTRRIDESGQ